MEEKKNVWDFDGDPFDKNCLWNGNRRLTDAWFRDQLEALKNLRDYGNLDMVGLVAYFEDYSDWDESDANFYFEILIISLVSLRYTDAMKFPYIYEDKIDNFNSAREKLMNILDRDENLWKQLEEKLPNIYQDYVRDASNRFPKFLFPDKFPLDIHYVISWDFDIYDYIRSENK